MSLFTKQPEDILVVSRDDPHDPLSSFSRHGFFLDGKEWPSVEHYYQAKKFMDEEYQEAIRNTDHPKKARKLGRSRRQKIRSDWKKIRQAVMTRALYTKVQAHPEIGRMLLETGNRHITETTLFSYYWGIGRDGRGKNTYGKVLMGIRQKLREKSAG